jgi:hypothetical protein
VEYLLTFGLLVAMNVTPVPLPPSWLVVSYLSVELDVDPVIVVIVAAAGAATGRTLLATWTRALGPRLMTRGTRDNIGYLAERLRGPRTNAGVALTLAVSPPPSGALYTAAGLLRIPRPLVFGSCFAGRLVTYGVGVALAGTAADAIADRLRDWAGPLPIALGLAALAAALWLLGRMDWRSTIASRRPRLRAGRAASPRGGPAPRG